MSSKQQIANLAIAHVGTGDPISNLDTEQSQEVDVINLFYDVALDEMLRRYHWPFAKRTVRLTLVANDPTIDWAFSYRYPPDAVWIKRIITGVLPEPRNVQIPYQIAGDDTDKLIWTSQDEASVIYTQRFTDTEKFPQDFVMALAYRLAAYIAPQLTAGDPGGLGPKLEQAYERKINQAIAHAFNEEQLHPDPDSESILSRQGGARGSVTGRTFLQQFGA